PSTAGARAPKSPGIQTPSRFLPARTMLPPAPFFGFMKSSRGKSVGEMQSELRKELEQGQHSFTGILSRVEPSRALSTIVPLQSDTDFTLHQYDIAQPIMLHRIADSDRPVRSLEDPSRCL